MFVWATILLFLIVLLVLVQLKLLQNDLTLCDAKEFLAANPQTDKVYATKVAIEPWRGRHQVYALFIVPILHKPEYPVLLNIKGVATVCRRVEHISQIGIDGISPPQNSTVIKIYLRTRTTFWLMFLGKLNRLKRLRNWTLTYRTF